MKTFTRGSCVSKAWKPPSSRPVWKYFEFRNKPSLITVISMDPCPTNYLRQNIVFSYPEIIRVSFSLFLSLSVFCYFTLLLTFIKIILLLLLLFLFYLFIFMKIIFIFSCSGMFRNVQDCSMFLVLSTPTKKCLKIMRKFSKVALKLDLKTCFS